MVNAGGRSAPGSGSDAAPESWGPGRYGDPCRECGLEWSLNATDAITLVMGLPDAYQSLIGDADGSLRHPDLGWPLGGYVGHVADNLHIWAQWLAGAALREETAVAGYDEARLGEARYYTRMPVGGALWQLRQATESWHGAVTLAQALGVVLAHETRGPQSWSDVVRSNAHDAFHHAGDIRRILAYNHAAPGRLDGAE